MGYYLGYQEVNTRLDRKCGKGWEGSVGNCKRVKQASGGNKKRNNIIAASVITAATVGALTYAGRDVIFPFGKVLVGMAAEKAADTEKVDEMIDNSSMPESFKDGIKGMEGSVKVSLMEVALKIDGAKVQEVDKENQITTLEFKKKGDIFDKGSFYSLHKSKSNLVFFGTTRSNTRGDKSPLYSMGFLVNTGDKRQEGGMKDRAEGRKISSVARKMFVKHLDLMEDGSIIRVDAQGGDDAGEKRNRIYKRMGFRTLPRRGSTLWAIKENGVFTPISEDRINEINSRI